MSNGMSIHMMHTQGHTKSACAPSVRECGHGQLLRSFLCHDGLLYL